MGALIFNDSIDDRLFRKLNSSKHLTVFPRSNPQSPICHTILPILPLIYLHHLLFKTLEIRILSGYPRVHWQRRQKLARQLVWDGSEHYGSPKSF